MTEWIIPFKKFSRLKVKVTLGLKTVSHNFIYNNKSPHRSSQTRASTKFQNMEVWDCQVSETGSHSIYLKKEKLEILEVTSKWLPNLHYGSPDKQCYMSYKRVKIGCHIGL